MFSNNEVAAAVKCGRNTVSHTLKRAEKFSLTLHEAKGMRIKAVQKHLFPAANSDRPQYRMPDYEKVQREMQKSGVTLSLPWVKCCEECRANGELLYQSTQFNKYYAEYVYKTKTTIHLDHKPGETMQVDWAGDTMGVVDTDTGELIPAYLFVSVLPYSGYAYAEAFLDMKYLRPCHRLPLSQWRHKDPYPGQTQNRRYQKTRRTRLSSTALTARWPSITVRLLSAEGPGSRRIKLMYEAPSGWYP